MTATTWRNPFTGWWDRFWFEPNHVYFFVGFRLAHSLTDSET